MNSRDKMTLLIFGLGVLISIVAGIDLGVRAFSISVILTAAAVITHFFNVWPFKANQRHGGDNHG